MIRRTDRNKVLTYSIITLVFGFGVFQFTSSLFAMPLHISNIENGASVETPFFALEGNAKKAVTLLVNDTPVLLQKDGNFNTPMTFAPGYNTFSIQIENRIGKKKEQTFNIFVNKDGKILEGKTTDIKDVEEAKPPDEPVPPITELEANL